MNFFLFISISLAILFFFPSLLCLCLQQEDWLKIWQSTILIFFPIVCSYSCLRGKGMEWVCWKWIKQWISEYFPLDPTFFLEVCCRWWLLSNVRCFMKRRVKKWVWETWDVELRDFISCRVELKILKLQNNPIKMSIKCCWEFRLF